MNRLDTGIFHADIFLAGLSLVVIVDTSDEG